MKSNEMNQTRHEWSERNAAPTSPMRGGKPRGQQTTHPSIAAGHGKPAIDWIECCPRGESWWLSWSSLFVVGYRRLAAIMLRKGKTNEDKQLNQHIQSFIINSSERLRLF